MIPLLSADRRRVVQNIARIPPPVADYLGCLLISVVLSKVSGADRSVVRFAASVLRVIRRQTSIEYEQIFMAPHRHLVGIQETHANDFSQMISYLNIFRLLIINSAPNGI